LNKESSGFPLERIMTSRLFVPAVAAVLAMACMSASAVEPRPDLLGSRVPSAAAVRTVNLGSGVQSINVVSGDTVRFVGSGGEFAWTFNTSPIVQVFNLSQVAPNGTVGQETRVYVAPSPLYSERAQFNDNDRQDTRLPAVVR
jgi:hypothetical protein